MLDFFGVGLNESFTENHIDHRARSRFRAVRDVTHAVGFVEDLLPASRPVRSEVALLVSESTERWDNAGIATRPRRATPSSARTSARRACTSTSSGWGCGRR